MNDAELAILRAHRRGDQIDAEESGLSGTSSKRRWYVDPLRGTVNFAAGCRPIAVSAGR